MAAIYQNYTILDVMDYHFECGFNTAQTIDTIGQSDKKGNNGNNTNNFLKNAPVR
jgi:hypothetical protein